MSSSHVQFIVLALLCAGATGCCPQRGQRGPTGYDSPALVNVLPFSAGVENVFIFNQTAANLPWYMGYAQYQDSAIDFQVYVLEAQISGTSLMLPTDETFLAYGLHAVVAMQIPPLDEVNATHATIQVNATVMVAPLTDTFADTELQCTMDVPPFTAADDVVRAHCHSPASATYTTAGGDRLLLIVKLIYRSTTEVVTPSLDVAVSAGMLLERVS